VRSDAARRAVEVPPDHEPRTLYPVIAQDPVFVGGFQLSVTVPLVGVPTKLDE
jgi:hypothetical protein